MHNVWLIASTWMGIALLASLISIRLGVSVALIEILLGVIAGNTVGIKPTEWINFLASFGAVLRTFLAGAEIDPQSLRSHLKASLSIGAAAFLFPFLGVLSFVLWLTGWSYPQSLIGGIALSTTSVAVVYAVLVENGLNRSELGKMILAACFVNDFGTVLALGGFFANFNRWMALFVAVMAVALYFLPSCTRWIIDRLGRTRVSEPEVKFLFVVLFVLGGLAAAAKSEAVLPAYLAGLVVAGVFVEDRVLVNRMRSIAFTMLTPFYFIKAGLYVSLPALMPTAGLVVVLLGIKMLTKFLGVWPLSYWFRIPPTERMYTTLLMSTGLTFGTISALFGLENHALHIARADERKLRTIFVEEMPRFPGAPGETNEERERADAIFEQLRQQAIDAGKAQGVEVIPEKRAGHPAQALVNYIWETKTDLLIIGHTGHSGVWGTFMGTTADKVVRHATCSVLVVR